MGRTKRFKKNKNDTNIKEKVVLGSISLIITLVLFSIISGFAALMDIGSKSMPAGVDAASNKPVNILLLGMDIGDPDQVDNTSIKRTDTIMLVNYNPQTKKIQAVSIPRDTLITINKKNAKINAAYALGGYSQVKKEVENLLNINVNYIVKVDYNAFVQVIDAIGGITMDIDRNMIYDDEGQNLHINFKAGETVKMDGQKAQEFFRWRKNNDGSGFANGDLDRIQNQQKFISKVVDKCTSPFILFRMPKIMSAIGENVETNMTPIKIFKYGFKFMLAGKDNISMTTINGTPKTIGGQSYLISDKNQNKDIISSLGGGASSASQSKSSSSEAGSSIRIKILNGTKVNGLAGKFKGILTNLGYTKIDTGNTELTDKSEILTSSKDSLSMIQGSINIKKSDKKPDKAEYKDYDVIIILGNDYKKFLE